MNSQSERAKEELLSGRVSLRTLSATLGIDRDTLKNDVLKICSKEEAIKLEQILAGNKASSTIEINEELKQIIISILKGEITLKQASEETGIDRETLRRKVEIVANSSPDYIQHYIRYKSRRGDYSGIDFRRLFIELIENDMSQTEIAEKYGIPVRTMSRELEKIGKSEDEQSQRLYDIAKIYAEKKMKHEKFSEIEKRLYSRILKEIKDKIPYITIEEGVTQEELRIRRLKEFLVQVEQLSQQGLTREQIAKQLNIGVSTIRRRQLELNELIGLKKKRETSKEPDEPI